MNLLRVDFDFGDLATTETAELLGASLRAEFSFPSVGPTGPSGPMGPAGPAGAVSGTIAWTNVTGKPTSFPPSAHTHVAADVTDFAVAVAAVSPPVDWNSLTGKPATFAPSAHTHPISEVTNLQTALDGKAATSHTHTANQVTDFNTAAAAAAPVQSVNGSTGAVTVSVPTASSATPSALGTAAAGTSTDFARADHVHAMPSAADVGAAAAAHSSTHHTGGTDAIAPISIGAQSLFTTTTNSITGNTTITAGRALIYQVVVTGGSPVTADINLPSSGHLGGDIIVVRSINPFPSGSVLTIKSGIGSTLDTITAVNQAFRYTASGTSPNAWNKVLVDTHTHASTDITGLAAIATSGSASDLTTGTVDNARINFAAPAAIGSTTPNTGAFTTLSASSGTITTSQPVSFTQTWNNAAVAFTALRVNVTNTASSSSSSLFQVQVGGSNRLNVTNAGGTLTNGQFFIVIDSSGVRLGNSSSYVTCADQNSFMIRSDGNFAWSSSTSLDQYATRDVWLRRDAAGVLAQYNGTNAQESRLYGTFTSSTNYQRMTVKSVRQTLSALSGASATTTGTFIPDGAVVVGVTTRVTTLLTGSTGYTIGDGTDADRWGDITGTAIGTTSDNRDWTAGTIECFTAGGEITLTAKTSNFTAGAIEICVFYLAGQAD